MSEFGKFLCSPPPGEEIVITGISGKFPDSANMSEFKDHLINKEDMVKDIKLRWNVNYKDLPQRGGMIKVLDKFDPGFFGIHPRQAQNMDPMMRIFLETAIEAIFDAGLHPSELEGTKTGVYIGACWADAEFITLTSSHVPQRMGMTGALRSLIPQRLAYFLKLKGPCVVADTACSSSLNALERAFKDIRNGICDSAIVGSSHLILLPGSTLQFMKLGVLSKDGKCKVFDEEADGYVRSDAIPCMVLQKSKDAKRIYAQIVHVKANCDGYKQGGITFPSTEMQSALMSEVYEECGIHPNELCYLEGHCTGTRVGDPQEIEAIDNVLGKKRDNVLLIGSVKSSIGHTEPSSGLCSLSKVLIAMETGLIPANLHLQKIKKGLTGFEEGRLKAVTETTPFEGDQVVIGINNFGFGGNNCHVVLKRLNKKRDLSAINDSFPRLLCVSGRTKEAVLQIFEDVDKQPFNVEYIRLLQEVFKHNIESHHYRGYAIIAEGKPMKRSVALANSHPKPLHFHFGKFEKCYKIIGRAFNEFPPFKESLKSFNMYLSDKNYDIFSIIEKNERDPIRDILGSIAAQIGIGDIMKSLKLYPKKTSGNSWGKLVSLYFEGILNIRQVINIILETANNINPEDMLQQIYKKLGVNEFMANFDKNSIILNISNSIISQNQDVYINDQATEFMEIIGRLYETGYNPQIHNLFPKIEFPVSRGTPMISPSIKWDYSKDWYYYRLERYHATGDYTQVEVHYSPFDFEHTMLQGHVVDGRNLYPATGYLYIVWKALSHTKHMSPNDMPIVFENVRFVKAVTYPKSDLLVFLITVQTSGAFEITQGDNVVVTGHAYVTESDTEMSDLPVKDFDEGTGRVLEHDDVYKELHLRGYNYKGMFKNIVKINQEATCGIVRWEDNWIAFLDNLFQMKILQHDSRNLYVPVGIKRCVIDPRKHVKVLSSEIPITLYKEANIIKCDTAEIIGLDARSIAKKRVTNLPVLEKYVFVPNIAEVSIDASLRINSQLILETSLESTIRSFEMLDDDNEKIDSLLLQINKILEGVPLINADFTISTKRPPEDFEDVGESVKVERNALTIDNNYHLIVGSRFLSDATKQQIVFKCIKPNSFIFTREDKTFKPGDIGDVKILTVHQTKDEQLVLLRKVEKPTDFIQIAISSKTFDWLPKLQDELKSDSKSPIILFSCEYEDGILGLVNCILREKEGKRLRCFFIMDPARAPKFDLHNEFYKSQLDKNLPINVFKDGVWGTYRHLLLGEPEEVESEHCFVDNLVKGDLSTVRWLQGYRKSEEVTDKAGFIKVHYAALNFKDVMLASGRITADVFFENRLEQSNLLGFEYSGRNLYGKRVMGMIQREGLSTMIEADPTFVIDCPDDWSLDEAATIPVVYATVIYGVVMRAKLRRGMSILVHAGTGGIGLAALNVATYFKCNIFVTVGTQEKRNFLKQHYPHIPESHIGNSRDTTFEQMIEKETNGRGVDIVLNSLAEEKLLATVRCLAKGGSFVEIGKFDLAQDNPLNLLLLEKEASFHGVMLDIIFKEVTTTKLYLLSQLNKGISEGYIKPLPRKIFKSEEVEDAFRFMASGKHIGKVMVQIRENEDDNLVKVRAGIPRVFCNKQKSTVIIGGLGGFGLELADWLVIRGCRKLVLSSRTGIKNGYQLKRINTWESYGVKIHISTADVTTKAGCLKLIKEAENLGQIESIYNLGVVLKDAAFDNQNEENFRESFGPKAWATKYLDEITRERCPDLKYFVVFSSISCGRGNAGQSNYGMSNSVMERICENRRRDGLAGVAIEWGAIGDVGLVAQLAKNNIELEIRGTLQQRISNCLEVMDHLINQRESAIVASMVVAQKRKRFGSGTAVDAVLSILGVKDINKINRHATLPELGLDSITATEIIQVLETDFDMHLSPKDMRTMTLDKLMEAEKLKNRDPDAKVEDYHKLITNLPDIIPADTPLKKMPSNIDTETNVTPVAFILPGFEGLLTPLEALTKKLRCICYGLRYTYKDNVDCSVKSMALCYLPEIENKLTKEKPFILIGHSFGTILATEIAQILESKGYRGKIYAIDGSIDYFQATIRQMFTSKEDIESTILYNLLSTFIPAETLAPHKSKLKELKTFEERMDLAASIVPANMRKSEDAVRKMLVVAFKRLMAGNDYETSTKLKSDVYLYKASVPMVEAQKDYGWPKYCEGVFQMEMMKGNHSTIVENDDLATKINALLLQ